MTTELYTKFPPPGILMHARPVPVYQVVFHPVCHLFVWVNQARIVLKNPHQNLSVARIGYVQLVRT